jgi:hypothetical protein
MTPEEKEYLGDFFPIDYFNEVIRRNGSSDVQGGMCAIIANEKTAPLLEENARLQSENNVLKTEIARMREALCTGVNQKVK